GAALLYRDVLDIVPAGPRGRRRTTGGARGLADDNGYGIQFARRRVRSPGAGASALGAAAATYLATDRPGPPQRLVRMVHRSRTAAADDLRCNRPVAAAGGIRDCDRARTAHADVVRSAIRAIGDCRAGAAVSGLGNPRRHPGAAALAGGRGFERKGAALGCIARRLAARDIRHRAA